jgi:hypothetical protein
MTRQTLRLTHLSLSALALLSINSGALADTTVERTTTFSPLYPQSTITTVRKTVEQPDSTRLLVVPAQPLATRSSVTTVVEGPFMGRENFERRLLLMKTQLDTGIARGWIGSDQASALNYEYANLRYSLDIACAHGITDDLGNSLEKQLNQFNIDVSNSMSTASAGLIQ